MSEGKRRDSRPRTRSSRPGRSAEPGRGRPRAPTPRRERRPVEHRTARESVAESAATALRRFIAVSTERQSEQRLGSTARRAAILAAVVCVLTLTIAGPIRTFFAQRTEMRQLAATEAALRKQIAELQQEKVKLADPAFIAAQARERLGFVMPGEIPYQVQLPPGAATPKPQPGVPAPESGSADPWYTALWHTIADSPHNVPVPPEPAPPPDAAPGG